MGQFLDKKWSTRMNQDVPSRLHEQHLKWLTAKQAHQQKKLAVTKELIVQDPDFDEAKELVNELQKDVAYCENILEYLKKNFNQQSDCSESQDVGLADCNENQDGVDEEDNDFPEDEDDNFAQDDSTQRAPVDMLRPEYKGMSMFDIIERILADTSQELSSEDVTRIAYDTNSEDEFLRAKGSMSAQLRIGASKGKWAKVERGHFASNTLVMQNQNGHLH